MSLIEESPIEHLEQYYHPKNAGSRPDPRETELVQVAGLPNGYTAYNPASPDGNIALPRIALAGKETASEVWLCRRTSATVLTPTGIKMQGEDPYHTRVKVNGENKILFSCVITEPDPQNPLATRYRSGLWLMERWEDLARLDPSNAIALTPFNQKGVKITQLEDGSPWIIDRPQGKRGEGGTGVICMGGSRSFEDFSDPAHYQLSLQVRGAEIADEELVWIGNGGVAPIKDEPFKKAWWGHIAYRANPEHLLVPVQDGSCRVYHAATGILDLQTYRLRWKILCTPAELLKGPVRYIPGKAANDLEHVFYLTALYWQDRHLYTEGGRSDASIMRFPVRQPKELFFGYEACLPTVTF